MKALTAVLLALAVTASPVLAKQFVQDQAGMLSPATVSDLNSRISNFNAQTGKEVVVETVPSVTGGDVRTAAENAFAQQQVNGVLIFVDKGDRKSYVLPDRAALQAGWWTTQTSQSIVQAMNSQFRAGDYDGGVTTAVNQSLDIYRSHLGSLRSTQPVARRQLPQQQAASGVHISVFWWIIIALFAFFIIRSIMRAASGPRYYGGPGAGGPGPGYGPGPGSGYGYGGYGPGWGGGGGFFSGLLGGLGGAWLGNELFGGRNFGGGAGGDYAGVDPNAGNIAPSDAGGWQSDPGQADVGGGSGGDWGGGGFGGGDFGGGGFGGGDSGGGAGGGW